MGSAGEKLNADGMSCDPLPVPYLEDTRMNYVVGGDVELETDFDQYLPKEAPDSDTAAIGR